MVWLTNILYTSEARPAYYFMWGHASLFFFFRFFSPHFPYFRQISGYLLYDPNCFRDGCST